MANYRFLAYSLVANSFLDELPVTSSAPLGSALNAAGGLTIQVARSAHNPQGVDPTKAVRDLDAATAPARTAVFVDRDGGLTWGGIIWTRRRTASGATWELGCSSFESYFDRRVIKDDLTYTGIDQLTIAAALVTYAQAQPGGNIGITVPSVTSGVTRTMSYNAEQRTVIGQALRDLAGLDQGFDFAIRVDWVAGVPTKTLELSYPGRGRRGNPGTGAGDIVFES